jgi:hypothetical protein
VLGLIEQRIVPKDRLRKAVREVLYLNDTQEFATHEALLQLARSKDGRLRLVTTNFDQGFELAKCDQSRAIDYAPYLPVPGKDWNSIVHIHGGLGNKRAEALDALVLTSGDFGRAYITEGYASRFLTELFRRVSSVLFVGYSVSDPAVRYIVDAFAADRANREFRVAKTYLLTSEQDEKYWRARGIHPILYDQAGDHRVLHDTLQIWAKKCRSGSTDRDAIIKGYGSISPRAGLDPEPISQVIWALNDKNGHSARTFAGLMPCPPLEWLEILDSAGLFSLAPDQAFSVSPISLVPARAFHSPLHSVTAGLSEWLAHYLEQFDLIDWVIAKGAHLHPAFAFIVRKQISGDEGSALPAGAGRIWRFLSAETPAVYSEQISPSYIYDNIEAALEKEPWTPFLRDRVLSALAPNIKFERSYRHAVPPTEGLDENRARSYARLELTPAAGSNSGDIVAKLLGRSDFASVAAEIVSDAAELLHRGLRYLESLGLASTDADGLYAGRPSIDDHTQNRRFKDWSIYIDLLRGAWEGVAISDSVRAREEVTKWIRIPFPMFRRFVLWSNQRCEGGGLSGSEVVTFIIENADRILWAADMHRELLQCLRGLGSALPADLCESLVNLILIGPPRSHYPADWPSERFVAVFDRSVLWRLLKLRVGGTPLSPAAHIRISEILARHPEWPDSTSERDEFLSWFSEASGPLQWDLAPTPGDYRERTEAEVVADIRADPTGAETQQRWRRLAIDEPTRLIPILEALGTAGFFDPGIWQCGLENLVAGGSVPECLRIFTRFGPELGDEFIRLNVQTLAGLVERYCRDKKGGAEDSLWRMWDMLADPAVRLQSEPSGDSFEHAHWAPAGQLAEALLIKLGELAPASYDEIPSEVRMRLESLLTGQDPGHRWARLVLSKSLAWLNRLNPDLAKSALLPKFDRSRSEEATDMWKGFLYNPQVTPDLWQIIAPMFLKMFPISQQLGQSEEQLYAVLAWVLLQEGYPLAPVDARRALTKGTLKGRARVAWYWTVQVDSDTEYGAALFRERLKVLLESVWPIEREFLDESISKSFAHLALCCGSEFPNAVDVLRGFLVKTEQLHDVLHYCKEKHVPETFPGATLKLLDALVGERLFWSLPELRAILGQISSGDPQLVNDPMFIRLETLVRSSE